MIFAISTNYFAIFAFFLAIFANNILNLQRQILYNVKHKN